MDSRTRKIITSKDKIGIEKHFKLSAGPGAGKTTFLVNHIKDVLTNSHRLGKNKKIACITYTNIATESILKKLDKSIDKVEISTIHSFLFKHIVKPYIFLISEDYNISIEKIKNHEEDIFHTKPFQEWYESINAWGLWENISTTRDFFNSIKWILDDEDNVVLKPMLTSKTYKLLYWVDKDLSCKYKEICWEKGLISHEDVLFFAHEIIKKENRVLDIIRAKFPYMFLDEFQDTSPIQEKIVRKIGEKETIIGVIGDYGQSIYKFQGADVKKFSNFKLKNMEYYEIKDNYRSTEEVIKILNHIRNEENFIQKSPENKNGGTPYIIVGNFLDAYSKAIEFTKGDLYTLSYRNETANLMKFKSNYDVVGLNELMDNDPTKYRAERIFYCISSIEYCKQNKISDALKYMKKAHRKVENFTDKNAFEKLYRLFNKYEEFGGMSLKKFYNNNIYDPPYTMDKISRGDVFEYYESITYNQLATAININEDNSLHKTIHKAKGDEFDNVMLILLEKDNGLEFLQNPDLETKEMHRIFYVALSRAKKNLFINIPNLPKNKEGFLEKLGFKVVCC